MRRREPRSLERHDLRLGALARQERGSVRHHLAAAVQHRGAQIGRVTELPTVCARTLLGDFELDAVVRRPVAKRAVPDSGTKSFDTIPTAVRFCCTFSARNRKQILPASGCTLMDQDPGTAELSPATKQLSRSTSAVRMLRHRERRRKGLRFLGIELREREIEALIRRGRLLTPLEKSKPIVADVSRSTVLGAIPRKASHPDCRRLRGVGSARAGADDPGPSKGNILASSDCPHALREAVGRKRNGEAIACTFGDTVGSFPDLVRPTLLCACKQPAIPYIGLHHE